MSQSERNSSRKYPRWVILLLGSGVIFLITMIAGMVVLYRSIDKVAREVQQLQQVTRPASLNEANPPHIVAPAEKKTAIIATITLNIDRDGNLIVSEGSTLKTEPEIELFLRHLVDEVKKGAKERGDNSGEIKTTVNIRSDARANIDRVLIVLRLCQKVGFRNLNLQSKQ